MSRRFHILSLVKAILGIAIMVTVYVSIDPFLDPVAAIGFGFSGFFLAVRGVLYYLFYGTLRLFSPNRSHIHVLSYKVSLILGFFFLTNITLFFLEQRTIASGIVVVGLFVLLLFLMISHDSPHDDTHHELHTENT